MANCPHCSEALGSGFMTQEDHEARIKAKNDAAKLLENEIATLKTKASGFDAIVAERDTLKAEITKRDERQSRTDAMSEAGLDPSLLDHVEILYASAVTGQDQPKSLAEWLKDEGKNHPLLSDKFGKPGEQPAPKPGEQPAPKPNLNPPVNDDAADPGKPGQKITVADVQAYIASPEYQGLTTEKKREKLGELRSRVHAQENPGEQPPA